MSLAKPWLKFYKNIPESLDYPHKTMYELVKETAGTHPREMAYEFLGSTSSYQKFINDIDHCASCFTTAGLKKGDRVTISLPNSPQALIAFYALNKIGAVASMIHPLSPPKEIEFYLRESQSVWGITLDAFYSNFKEILGNTSVEKLILCKIGDHLSAIMKFLFYLSKGRKIAKVPEDPRVVWWQDLMAWAKPEADSNKERLNPDEMAVILYSGGTTGMPKGIMLSSRNFNCLGLQTAAQVAFTPGEKMLSILPVFHGFGLGVCIHTMLIIGGTCVLVPQFDSKIVIKNIKKHSPQYMAGVPTLYEAILRDPGNKNVDFSCLKGAFAGGDSLPYRIKKDFDNLVKRSGGHISLREGYGLTESVTACILMPETEYREKSIGIPFPDMAAKIVRIGSQNEVPVGEDGELCIAGPTLMLGYLNHEEETAKTLIQHEDGYLWLHTGDICSMDEDGFIYFKLRLKRMIKCSGVSVYPSQVEEILESHQQVQQSCVIGIPDQYQMHRLKAFAVLKNNQVGGPELAKELISLCKKHLIKWSVPAEVEFRQSLPLTRVGKVDFNQLEQEEFPQNSREGE